ncbi:hypothetical protein Tco_0418730 [Tanacetum coccineum]
MLCGAVSITETVPKSTPRNFKMAVIEDAGFKPCKMGNSTNLIDLKNQKHVIYIWLSKLLFLMGSSRRSLCQSILRFEGPGKILLTSIVWKKALYGLKQAPRGVVWTHSKVPDGQQLLQGCRGSNMRIHAGCQDTRRSTWEVLQFLGDRLITMAEQNVQAQSSTRTMSRCTSLSVNFSGNSEEYQTSSKLLVASANVGPAIYLQQFWKTISITRKRLWFISVKLDEQWLRDSAASGSAHPPPKDDDQSSKKPRESDASASKQHPALTSTGWQITDSRDAGVDSSMHRSDPESEHSEQSSDDIPMQDEGNDSDMEDTDNAHIPKVSTTTWFKPIPESERPATPEPEWTIPPNDFPEPEINWANTYATTYQVPAENKLQRKTYDIGSFIKWFCRRTGKKKLCKADLEGPAFNLVKAFHKNSVFLQYQMDECHKLLTNKVDLSNPEGHQILQNIYEPLPLGGPPGQVTIQPQFFFNKDLDYLLTGDKERKIALSISKLKAARYLDFGLEELVPSLWVESEREIYFQCGQWPHSLWWGLEERNSTSINTVSPLIVKQSDRRCQFSVSEKDFKNLHPNDFEDLFLLNIQEKLNHLPKTDKTSLHTAVNMWIRNLVIRNRVGDLQLGIESYQTKINLDVPLIGSAPLKLLQRRLYDLMGLDRFMDKPDQMVKDFKLYEYNKGMETRKWSEDDKRRSKDYRSEAKTTRRRSKDFITAIEKRLQIRRIYRSLESFVGGRIRDIDYRLINRTT